MVGWEAQFVIVTHLPIILAHPGEQILQFHQGAIREVKYNELEHVNLTRDFLANPEAFLRHL